MLRKRSIPLVAAAIIGHHPYPLNRRDRRAIEAERGREETVAALGALRNAGVAPKAGPTRAQGPSGGLIDRG